MFEFDHKFNGEWFTIMYDWLEYAEVRQVLNKEGDFINIDDNEYFLYNCEEAANEHHLSYLQDYYYDD